MQAVLDRVTVLRERFKGDPARLDRVNEAFRTLQAAESYAEAQRNAATSRTRSRSERELDGKLTELAMKAGQGQLKRISAGSELEAKKQRTDEDSVIKPEPGPSNGDGKVFDKLNSLLRDETKFHRAVSVLFNIVQSTIEKQQFDMTTVRMLSSSVNTATEVSGAAGRPLANLNEDNRKATTRVVNLILATDDLVALIDPNLVKSWSHSVLFRNSLFEIDNFNFVKKCKELVSLVSDAKTASDQWLSQLLMTIETISSKDVCKAIPGRVNDTKSTMVEIYKLSRDSAYPESFRVRVAELQKQFMSSLV
jgi:hypothetical protein